MRVESRDLATGRPGQTIEDALRSLISTMQTLGNAAIWLALYALPVFLLLMLALTSEQVEVNGEGLHVGHPAWCRAWLRRGWHLPWHAITALTPVTTSQGGRVYYVRGEDGSAWLLPQRVARFDDFLSRFASASR